MKTKILNSSEICNEVINTGINRSKYTRLQLIILGILAGAFIALGAFSAALASHGVENLGLSKFIAGIIFPVGLMLVVFCGAELFTGNCLMVVALADRKVTVKDVVRNWIIVYITNFLGALLIAALVYYSGLLNFNDNKLGSYAIKVATNKANLTFIKALCSGILCNIVVCLAVWAACAAKDVAGKLLAIWFPIMAFVVAGYEHSVANMYYFSIGLLAKADPVLVKASGFNTDKLASLSMKNIFLNNVIPVTLGNIIGGSVLVGLSYYVIHKYKRKD